MKQLKLSVSHREVTGTRACKRLRKEGQVPAVIYGRSGNESISVNESELRKLLRATAGSATLVEVVNNKGGMKLTIIEKLHREPATGAFLHVDFHEVSANEEMHVTLPVHTAGECAGVKLENGMLEVVMHQVEVKCLPKDLPEYITVDVANLHVGNVVHLKDLPEMKGVTFIGDPEGVIVSCSEARSVEEEVVAPAPVEVAEVKEEVVEKPAES